MAAFRSSRETPAADHFCIDPAFQGYRTCRRARPACFPSLSMAFCSFLKNVFCFLSLSHFPLSSFWIFLTASFFKRDESMVEHTHRGGGIGVEEQVHGPMLAHTEVRAELDSWWAPFLRVPVNPRRCDLPEDVMT